MSRKQVIWDIYTFEGIVPGENTYYVVAEFDGRFLDSSQIANLAYGVHEVPKEFQTKKEAQSFVEKFITSGIVWNSRIFNVRPKYTQHTSEGEDPDDGLDPLMTDFRNEDGDSNV